MMCSKFKIPPQPGFTCAASRRFSLVVAILCLGLLTAVAQPAAAEMWVVQRVDSPKYFVAMTGRSLRLDQDGHACIAYGGDRLYYAHCDGGTWLLDVADAGPGVGWYASLALDEQAYPHISYRDRANGSLKYAYQNGSGWNVKTVVNDWAGNYTSLALDSQHRPHIGYSTRADLRYTYWDGAEWHFETVDSGGYLGYYASLALNGQGYASIAYLDSTNQDLKYAYRDGSGWHVETVDSEGDVGSYTSLAVDEHGCPHISYFDWTKKDLKYAYHDGSG